MQLRHQDRRLETSWEQLRIRAFLGSQGHAPPALTDLEKNSAGTETEETGSPAPVGEKKPGHQRAPARGQSAGTDTVLPALLAAAFIVVHHCTSAGSVSIF